ncbi:MAG: hydrogenase maturation protease [Phormidesmis sp.]
MTRSSSFQSVASSRFLIIGYGNELRGDDAVGPRVADIVANWHLPSVKSISVHQLTPELVNDISATDYVIFVDACSGTSCARTVQLDPIVVGDHSSRTLAANDTHSCNPLALLHLTEQLCSHTPQAWFLQVPIESFGFGKDLSSTTKRGCDQAVRTIEQFLKTYQHPTWLKQTACMKSA